jgi:hypothetical protein
VRAWQIYRQRVPAAVPTKCSETATMSPGKWCGSGDVPFHVEDLIL